MIVLNTLAGWIVIVGSKKVAGPFLNESQAKQWVKERIPGWSNA